MASVITWEAAPEGLWFLKTKNVNPNPFVTILVTLLIQGLNLYRFIFINRLISRVFVTS